MSRSDPSAPLTLIPIGRSVAELAASLGIPDDELTPRIRTGFLALLNEISALRDEVNELHSRVAQLEKIADEDVLTPVLNRRAFLRELTRMAAFVERYGGHAGIIYIDVNGMKRLNDAHGHAAGDAALERIADLILSSVRSSDVVGRLGGDEFGVLLTQADREATIDKASRLLSLVAGNPLTWRGHTLPLSISAGAYVLRKGVSAQAALDGADEAMYAQKHARQE